MDDFTPRCHCGSKMTFKGYGAFPYECIAKDKHPNAAVFIGCETPQGGPNCKHEHYCWEYVPVLAAATAAR